MPFQREGVDYIKERRYALLADDMGLGKTIQSLAASVELEAKKILVICPASLILQWEEKIFEFYPKIHCYNSSTKTAFSCMHFSECAAILSYSMAVKPGLYEAIKAIDWDIAIIDEAHFLKNCKAGRTDKILGKHSFLSKAKRILLMTGTPVINRPFDIFLLLKIFAKDLLGRYANEHLFKLRFCGYMGQGASHTDELGRILQSFMLRRTKEEVSDQLPVLVETNVLVKTQPVPEDEYLATQRRLLGVSKVPATIKYIDDLLQTVEKVVIITYHKEVLEQLEQEFSAYNPRSIYGGLSATNKDSRIKDFINDASCRILLGQINTLGYGVDGLQKVCNRIVFAELDWGPSGLRQAIDRLRRIGQEQGTVFVDYIQAVGTLDDWVDKKIGWKEKIIGELTGDNMKNDYHGEIKYLDMLNRVYERDAEKQRRTGEKNYSLPALQNAITVTQKRIDAMPSEFKQVEARKIKEKEKKQMAKKDTDASVEKAGQLLLEVIKVMVKAELAAVLTSQGVPAGASVAVSNAAVDAAAPAVELTLEEITGFAKALIDKAEEKGIDRDTASKFYREKVLAQFNLARTADGTPQIWSQLKQQIDDIIAGEFKAIKPAAPVDEI